MPTFKPVYTKKADHGEVVHRMEKWIGTSDGWVKRILLLMSDGCVLWKHVKGETNWPLARKGRGMASRHYQTKKPIVIMGLPVEGRHTNPKLRWDEKYVYEHKKDGYNERETRIN